MNAETGKVRLAPGDELLTVTVAVVVGRYGGSTLSNKVAGYVKP